MKSYFKIFEKVKNQAGATAVIIAITLPMLIGFTALAVDMGYMYATKNELQNVADAAALAATRKLGTIYQGMAEENHQTYICDNTDIAIIKGVADAVAQNNKAGGKHIIVYDTTKGIDHVEIGVWDSSVTPPTLPFSATYNQPDAVRVTAHRDGSANGPITTFFAKIFGIDTVDVSADATAALTGQSSSEPGEIELPLGISSIATSADKCNSPIQFSPTKDACAGWNTFFEDPSNDKTVRTILQGMLDGTIESPATTGGDEFVFIGGELSDPTFNELLLLFKDKGYDVYVDYDDGNEILPPVATDAEGNPVTGHLDPSKIAQLIADSNVTVHAPVVPLLESDEVTPILYPDGGIETVPVLDDYGKQTYSDDGKLITVDNYILLTPRNKHVWPTKVAVYYEEGDVCGNPSKKIPIVGYATILLTDVIDKTIVGRLKCELVSIDDTRGGGGEHGTKGSIPCLVE